MSADVLVCRYRLTGSLAGASVVYSGHVFTGGATEWARLSTTDWERRDRVLCRFYGARREVEGANPEDQAHGGDHEAVQGDVQSAKPAADPGAEAAQRNRSTADEASSRQPTRTPAGKG